MTPKLRARCALTAASLFLLTSPVTLREESEAPDPALAPTANPLPSTSFAGRQAAEGRPRPGRLVPATPSDSLLTVVPPTSAPDEDTPPGEDAAREEEEPGEVLGTWVPAPSVSAGAAARHQEPRAAPGPAGQEISPLSLGAGMALMGLGIGFLGLRLRRR
ncbi:hypothetical protein [Streptomyces sp. NPDC002889]|uniref:hypothetical protein n=1 Tax=Streptomyces sp. NPDC002889 TaxID=3364669 RepID=UPI0036C205EA